MQKDGSGCYGHYALLNIQERRIVEAYYTSVYFMRTVRSNSRQIPKLVYLAHIDKDVTLRKKEIPSFLPCVYTQSKPRVNLALRKDIQKLRRCLTRYTERCAHVCPSVVQ